MTIENKLFENFNRDLAAIMGDYAQGYLDEMAKMGFTNITKSSSSSYYTVGLCQWGSQIIHFEFAPTRFHGVYLSDQSGNSICKVGRRKFKSLNSMRKFFSRL